MGIDWSNPATYFSGGLNAAYGGLKDSMPGSFDSQADLPGPNRESFNRTPYRPDQRRNPWSSQSFADQANEYADASRVANRYDGTMDRTGFDKYGNKIDSLGQILEDRIAGKRPSVAEMQMRQGLERNRAGAASLAASQAGVNPALAGRQAQLAQSQASLQTNQDASILRAKEQAQAEEALGRLMMQARGQELGFTTAQGQQSLAAQGQIDDLTKFYMDMGASREEADRQAKIRYEEMAMQRDMFAKGLESQQFDREWGLWRDMAGGMVGAGSSMMAMGAASSDRRGKKKIKDADQDAQDFLDAISPSSYEYKEPDAPGRRHGKTYGVMAQDVAKSKVGRSFLTKTPDGMLALDIKGGLGALLATAASLGRRVKKLETQPSPA